MIFVNATAQQGRNRRKKREKKEIIYVTTPLNFHFLCESDMKKVTEKKDGSQAFIHLHFINLCLDESAQRR